MREERLAERAEGPPAREVGDGVDRQVRTTEIGLGQVDTRLEDVGADAESSGRPKASALRGLK